MLPPKNARARFVAEGPETVLGQVTSAFERAGVAIEWVSPASVPGLRWGDNDSAVVIGAATAGDAVVACAALPTGARALVVAEDPGTWSIGNDIMVIDAAADGRDILSSWRLAGAPRAASGAFAGEVTAFHSVWYLARTAMELRRTGVLAITRGFRRGELRFVDGELTSAQASYAHGKAAFHHLLLWTDGHFELRDQLLVRRQQIPMSSAEVLADATRFLSQVRDAAPAISPSMVFQRDPASIDAHLGGAPKEIWSILHTIDGDRSVADILQDTDFRLVETLHILSELVRCGAIVRSHQGRGTAISPGWDSLDDWLVGSLPARSEKLEAAAAADLSIDWVAMVPSSPVQDSGSYSPLVPSAAVSGEIDAGKNRSSTASATGHQDEASIQTRLHADEDVEDKGETEVEDEGGEEAERDRLETMDASARARIFAAVDAKAPTGPVLMPDSAHSQVATSESGGSAAVDTAGPASPETSAADSGDTTTAPRSRRESRDQSGEIRVARSRSSTADPGGEPSILIDSALDSAFEDASTLTPDTSELAEAAAAASRAAVCLVPPSAPPTPSAPQAVPPAPAPAPAISSAKPASLPHKGGGDSDVQREVREVAADAATVARGIAEFSADDEAFFAAGKELEKKAPAPVITFDDLDSDYVHLTFWERLRGKKKLPPPAARAKVAAPSVANSTQSDASARPGPNQASSPNQAAKRGGSKKKGR